MKLFSRSALVATVAAAALVSAAVPTSACMFSKSSASAGNTSFDGPSGLLDQTPDSNALGMALGGFGVIATLLTGGVVFYRKQRLARLEEQSAALATEFDLTATGAPEATETIMEATASADATAAETEQELALTR